MEGCKGKLAKQMSFGQKKKWQHFIRLMDEILPQNLPQRQIHPSVTLSDRDKQLPTDFDFYKRFRAGSVKKTQTGQTRKALNQVLQFYIAYVNFFPV